MKLIHRQDSSLLANTWAWVSNNGIELDPLFSNVEEAMEWAQKHTIFEDEEFVYILRTQFMDDKYGKSKCGRKTTTEGEA